MAHNNWCGKVCSKCINPCETDLNMLCSPDCKAINPKTNLADINLCKECGADLIEVSTSEAADIIINKIPLGKFYKNKNDLFVGIDNETGDAWVEEFDTREDCFSWLYGQD